MNQLGKYLMKRIGLMIVTFVITVFIFFVFIKMMPDNTPPQIGEDNRYLEKHMEREGWDKPIVVQFGYWVRNICEDGSFGFSQINRRDAASLYFSKIPASIKINIIPYILSIPIAIFLGVTAALYKDKPVDTAISVFVIIFISVPYFVVAVLSQYLFFFKLGWAPSHVIATPTQFAQDTWFGIKSYILPVAVLTITSVPGTTRSIRAELTEQLTADYMLLARSKGLSKQEATYKHALKNAIVPFLPGMIIGIVGVMSGGIITESIFRVDGTGRIYLDAFNSNSISKSLLANLFSSSIIFSPLGFKTLISFFNLSLIFLIFSRCVS
jgi:oligopeptide transport system permease protein